MVNNMTPTVTIVTLLTDRREFLPLLKACINNQNYDKSKLEWVILDDGDDNNFDFDNCSVKPLYFHCSEKLTIGRKRNIACRIATGEFITFFDDDDIHYPNRITAGVENLTKRGQRYISGSTKLDIADISTGKIYRSGPFAKNHATAGTFFFRKQFLSMSSFRDSDRAGEEAYFLKNYQTPMEQIRPEHTIICLAHSKNTISKKRFFKDEKLSGTLDEKKLPKDITSEIKKLKQIL